MFGRHLALGLGLILAATGHAQQITTPQIRDGAITTPKIAAGAVTDAKLASDGASLAAIRAKLGLRLGLDVPTVTGTGATGDWNIAAAKLQDFGGGELSYAGEYGAWTIDSAYKAYGTPGFIGDGSGLTGLRALTLTGQVQPPNGGAGGLTGLLKATSGNVSVAAAGTDYLSPASSLNAAKLTGTATVDTTGAAAKLYQSEESGEISWAGEYNAWTADRSIKTFAVPGFIGDGSGLTGVPSAGALVDEYGDYITGGGGQWVSSTPIVAPSFEGNGAALTDIDPENIGEGTANISIYGNAANATNAEKLQSGARVISPGDAGWDVLGGLNVQGGTVESDTGFTGDGSGLTNLPAANLTGTATVNTTGTASNVTGTVALANGGTGATTASAARTALGLAIGTDVLAPNGDGTGLSGVAKTGTANTFTGVQTARGWATTTQTLTDASTITWDASAGAWATVTLGGNRTLALPTNLVAGSRLLIRVVQDSTANRTLAFASGYKFPGAVAPVISNAASSVTLLEFVSWDGASLTLTNAVFDVR